MEYIAAVDKYRHFGQAAKACHISQPSLSMQIKKAEDLLGFVIFDRLKKPIYPTEAGKTFIVQIKNVIREHEKLVHMSKTEQGLQGQFNLAIIPTLVPYIVPLFIEDFSKKHPHVKLKIDELKTDTIIEALKNDDIDAGLLATPLHEAGIIESTLFLEPFSLYLSPKHPLLEKKRVSEDDLDASQMWLLQDGHCLRNQIIKFCGKQKGPALLSNVEFEGGNLETLRYLVKKTKSYTMVPYLFKQSLPASEATNYVRDFVAPVPQRQIGLVYRREQWKQDILAALKDSIIDNLPQELKDTKAPSKKTILKPLI